ncbi:hypothetical protein JCM14124_16810 [Humidesulfovibrio idahonensis]
MLVQVQALVDEVVGRGGKTGLHPGEQQGQKHLRRGVHIDGAEEFQAVGAEFHGRRLRERGALVKASKGMKKPLARR